MPEFARQDLSGFRFEHVDLQGKEFRDVDLSRTRFRGVRAQHVRISGSELIDVDISAELVDVRINGVDIAPLVEAELDRRYPERAAMRPTDPAGFRHGWDVVERLWDDTVSRARVLEPALPTPRAYPVHECLRIVLSEEWEHRLFAERDLDALVAR